MDFLGLHYLTLASAGIAAAIGILQARQARGGFRSRSAKTYSFAAVVLTLAIGTGLLFDSQQTILIAESFAFLLIAVGLLTQGKEASIFTQIAAQQRVDFVSGLPNVRAFRERLTAEHSRTKRTGMRYAIAVFEIDDYHMLPPADQVNGMKLLAKSLEDSVRNTDSLGRISDQHIAVMMVDTAAEGGIVGCDRARERFFFQSCAHDEAAHVTRPLTVSIGLAAFDEDTVDPNDVVENAKLALQRLHAEVGAGVRVYERTDFVRQSDTLAAAAAASSAA